MTMHKDGSQLSFDDYHVIINGNSGRSNIKYRFCHPDNIEVPPEKELRVDDPEITFTLTQEDFSWILKAASILGSPNIAVTSDGDKIFIKTLDIANNAAHTESLEIGSGNGHTFQMVFLTSNIMKLLNGEYEVKISSSGIACFRNTSIKLIYYVAVERESSYE